MKEEQERKRLTLKEIIERNKNFYGPMFAKSFSILKKIYDDREKIRNGINQFRGAMAEVQGVMGDVRNELGEFGQEIAPKSSLDDSLIVEKKPRRKESIVESDELSELSDDLDDWRGRDDI